MNAETENVISEWLQRAIDDLESAEVILNKTDNYEISVYHSHQAIEKALKAELLKRGKTFKFIHDLIALSEGIFGMENKEAMFEGIAFVNSLYPKLRYPTGENISKDQAEKSLKIAKEIFRNLSISAK